MAKTDLLLHELNGLRLAAEALFRSLEDDGAGRDPGVLHALGAALADLERAIAHLTEPTHQAAEPIRERCAWVLEP